MTIRKGRKIIAGNGGAAIASTHVPGLVQPDGKTILITEEGVISSQGGGNTFNTDDKTITTNENDDLQAIALLDSKDDNTAIKVWTGTKQEYDALPEKDDNIIYYVSGDTTPGGGGGGGAAFNIDNKTISFNEDNNIQVVGAKTLDGSFTNEWIGTTEQYEQAVADGVITPDTLCIITDDEEVVNVKGTSGLEIGDIGIAPLGIDESLGKRRYLNGSVVIQEQYPYFTQRVKTAIQTYAGLGCTEEEWQNISAKSVGGQCGKFVVDDTAGTIRLPKIIMPIQGLTDLTKLGEIVEAGLPNITASKLSADAKTPVSNGAFKFTISSAGYGPGNNAGWAAGHVDFDASLSNDIYGNSTTVQQEQIQYPYFIQVATGSEYQENITNEIELNNPFVLLEGQYFEKPVYNVSWLQSSEAFTGSLALHPTAYNALLVEYNTNIQVGTTIDNYTKRGLSVKSSLDEYTDYDFVIAMDEQTFRCPLKIKKASGNAVVGNGMTLGLTNGTSNYGVGTVANSGLWVNTSTYGADVGTSGFVAGGLSGEKLGITTDPTKSGIETSDSDLYLYFYVGETVQNANLVNVGRVEEKLSDLIPNNSELIASYLAPNFSEPGVSFATNVDYIAPYTGWIYTEYQNSVVSFNINDTSVIKVGSSTISSYMFLVNKSDKVKVTFAGGTVYNNYMIKCKGVN